MTPIETQTRLEMLERMVLELGSELYGLKSSVGKQRETHEQFIGIMRGLKQLLDEKGLITVEDFDAAVQIGEALEHFSAQQESGYEDDDVAVEKKFGH